MRDQGWRSVSVLMVPYTTVLFAADTAPPFPRHHQGVLAAGQIKMREVDGWQTLTDKLADKPIDLAA